MSIQSIKETMPEYAKDTKLNLSKIFTDETMEGLSNEQRFGIALASAYATKSPQLVQAVQAQTAGSLSPAQQTAAKAAAAIMAMNNVYYRFIHLSSDKEYGKMPANLRMNIIGNPGVDKVEFELMSLAISAINGCGMCMDAHVREVEKAGISKQGVQSCVRIASVIAAAAQVISIESMPASTSESGALAA